MKASLMIGSAFLAGASIGAWAQSPSTADQRFAKEAAGGGMAEGKLGQLAADKGSSNFVKQFGQKMVDDHAKANDNLKSVASKNNITLPDNMPAKDQALYDRLSKLSGKQFDSAYIAAMKTDHKGDIAAFKREANSGTAPDVKEFASGILPVIQQHLKDLETHKVM